MSEPQSNLNYEFYWLFQTQAEPAALPDFEEVKVESGNLYNIKMPGIQSFSWSLLLYPTSPQQRINPRFSPAKCDK